MKDLAEGKGMASDETAERQGALAAERWQWRKLSAERWRRLRGASRVDESGTGKIARTPDSKNSSKASYQLD